MTMKDIDNKRAAPYDIRESELNIILSLNDKNIEDHEFGDSRKKYFSKKDALNNYMEELSSTISMLESETERLKVMNGKVAVNENAIKDFRNEIMILSRRYSVVENPEIVLEEFRSQETRILELSEEKQKTEKDIDELDMQMQDDVDDIQILNARLGKISSEIADMKPQQDQLSEKFKDLEKSAKIFIERDGLEKEQVELEASVAVRTEDLNEVNNIISECNKLAPELEKNIKSLQGKLGALKKRARELEELMNERESLNEDITALEEDINDINLKVLDLTKEVETEEGALTELSLANAEMKKSVETTEKYIEDSAQKIKEINAAREGLSKSDKLKKDALSKMEGLFNKKMEMDKHMSWIGGAIKSINEAIEAVK